MARLTAGLLLLTVASLASGCAMCCAPFDCDYLYQGGAWVRHNPSSGRVGSAFDEAGGPNTGGDVLQQEPTPAEAGAEPIPVPTGTAAHAAPPRTGLSAVGTYQHLPQRGTIRMEHGVLRARFFIRSS
jgi:hypothetical protein